MKLKIICFVSMFLALMTGSVYASSKISTDVANVHISDTSVQVIDQLKKGTAINVLGSNGRLLKINYGNNLEGWIDVSCVKEAFSVTQSMNWIEVPSVQNHENNSQTGTSNGIVNSSYSEKLDALVELAWSKVGCGRTEPNWGDEWENERYTCNGFITYLYLHIYDEERGMAINLPCNGIYQADFCTLRYDASELRNYIKNGANMDDYLRPGDVVYFRGVNPNKAGHVEIYVGNEQTIGATGSRPDSVRVNNARESLLDGDLLLICRIIDGDNVCTKTPTNEIRPLRRFPSELNINIYDYEELQRQGVTVVEDNTTRNNLLKK